MNLMNDEKHFNTLSNYYKTKYGKKATEYFHSDSEKLEGWYILERDDLESMGITYVKGSGGYSGKSKEIIFCVVSRIELAQVKQTIKSIDEKAFISVENVYEVEGTRISKEKKLIDTRRILKVMNRKKEKEKKLFRKN